MERRLKARTERAHAALSRIKSLSASRNFRDIYYGVLFTRLYAYYIPKM